MHSLGPVHAHRPHSTGVPFEDCVHVHVHAMGHCVHAPAGLLLELGRRHCMLARARSAVLMTTCSWLLVPAAHSHGSC